MNSARKASLLLLAALLTGAAAPAAIHYVDLGTAAPPGSIGGVSVTAFDLAPQAAIPDSTLWWIYPGGPSKEDLYSTTQYTKLTVPTTWATWSHGYLGPVFYSGGASAMTFVLPPGAAAFYMYMEPSPFGWYNFTLVANGAVSSGPVPVLGNAGARGFGFYSDAAGESITQIVITADQQLTGPGFAVGEFGMSPSRIFTNVSAGVSMKFTSLTLNRRTGTLFGTLRIINTGQTILSAPFWYALKSSTSCRLVHPTGSLPGGYQYLDISGRMAAALPRIGNLDASLNPGETVYVSGIEIYSRTRQIPAGLLYALWADPPAGDADGDGAVSDPEILKSIDAWTADTIDDAELYNAIGGWKAGSAP